MRNAAPAPPYPPPPPPASAPIFIPLCCFKFEAFFFNLNFNQQGFVTFTVSPINMLNTLLYKCVIFAATSCYPLFHRHPLLLSLRFCITIRTPLRGEVIEGSNRRPEGVEEGRRGSNRSFATAGLDGASFGGGGGGGEGKGLKDGGGGEGEGWWCWGGGGWCWELLTKTAGV